MNQKPPILLIPGPSAAGRDYLIEKLIENADIVGATLGLGRAIKIGIAKKTTDRPSRNVDLLKNCITEEEFTQGLKDGRIIADYTLESNGKRYGYEVDAFDLEGVDLVVSDASVYQIPNLKKILGDRLHVRAMIASRDYRHENFKARGSEQEDEIKNRLNLGDAHVAIAMMMFGRDDYEAFISESLANNIRALVGGIQEGKNKELGGLEKLIEEEVRSSNVPSILKLLANDHGPWVDELIILGDQHRVSPDDYVPRTEFFLLGADVVGRTLGIEV